MSPQDRLRRRLRVILFCAVGLMSTGYIAAVSVSTLAARDLTGSALLAGLPAAVTVVSTAVGTSVLGAVVVRSGRRRSLILGVAAATVGAAIAAIGVFGGSLLVLLAGTAVLGFGNAASHLARYAAAELTEAAARGRAVSIVVWAGTIGAVAGPRLLEPTGDVALSMGGVEYAGGYLAAAVAMAAATVLYLVALRPDPSTLAVVEIPAAEPAPTPALGSVFARPAVQVALVAMVIGQVVMVLIMTATPIHVENMGHGLGHVGSIFSAHTLGMFAFAPLVGRVVDRIGSRTVIVVGAGGLIAAAVMAAVAPPHATGVLTGALFLLGLGWNLGFVAGSTLLSVSIEPEIRPLVQGRVDSAVWTASAVASFGAGFLLAGPGFTFVSYFGAGLVLLLVVVLAARGRSPAPVAVH